MYLKMEVEGGGGEEEWGLIAQVLCTLGLDETEVSTICNVRVVSRILAS